MSGKDEQATSSSRCQTLRPARDIETISLNESPPLPGYEAAMALAARTVAARLPDAMLISWYDQDQDFEAPQHVTECEREGALPGYVEYALSRDANLKVDIEHGRFVFYYFGLDI